MGQSKNPKDADWDTWAIFLGSVLPLVAALKENYLRKWGFLRKKLQHGEPCTMDNYRRTSPNNRKFWVETTLTITLNKNRSCLNQMQIRKHHQNQVPIIFPVR